MKNYVKTNIGNEGRVELHETLGLTGAEVSINQLPAGTGVPFVHSHKQNEEIYGILSGKGSVVLDGETVPLTAGDWLKVSPAAKRQFSAAADTGWPSSASRSRSTPWRASPPPTLWCTDLIVAETGAKIHDIAWKKNPHHFDGVLSKLRFGTGTKNYSSS